MKGLGCVGFVVVFGLVACDGSVPYNEVDGAESWDLAASDSMPADVSSVPEVAIGHDTGSVQNEMRLYKSGSRIKAKVMTTEDGAQAFATWYDTVLKVDCWITSSLVAEDGKPRCLPMGNYVYDNGYYSDSDCTKPLYWTGKSGDCPLFDVNWITMVTSTCGVTTYSFYRDGHIYGGASIYQKYSEGSCDDVTSSASRFQFLDALGKKQPPEVFAEAMVNLVE